MFTGSSHGDLVIRLFFYFGVLKVGVLCQVPVWHGCMIANNPSIYVIKNCQLAQRDCGILPLSHPAPLCPREPWG